jgi:hypothetical protein
MQRVDAPPRDLVVLVEHPQVADLRQAMELEVFGKAASGAGRRPSGRGRIQGRGVGGEDRSRLQAGKIEPGEEGADLGDLLALEPAFQVSPGRCRRGRCRLAGGFRPGDGSLGHLRRFGVIGFRLEGDLGGLGRHTASRSSQLPLTKLVA